MVGDYYDEGPTDQDLRPLLYDPVDDKNRVLDYDGNVVSLRDTSGSFIYWNTKENDRFHKMMKEICMHGPRDIV
jgi:hypothetical protein